MPKKYQTIEIGDLFKGLIDGNEVVKSTFEFHGFFNEIHPHYRHIYNWINRILKEHEIVLNIIEFHTVDDFCDPDMGYVNYNSLTDSAKKLFDIYNVPSADGYVYRLLQDTEMGRGWAVLFINEEVLYQEHRDTLIEYMLSEEFMKSLIPAIDYEYKYK